MKHLTREEKRQKAKKNPAGAGKHGASHRRCGDFTGNQFRARSFKPMIPQTIIKRHTIRITVAGSRKRMIPAMAAPTVPIPVQTA